MQEDIFDLAVSNQESDFIKKTGELEGEIMSDIIGELSGFHFIGPLIKLGKIGANYRDLHFVRKLGEFLVQSRDISIEEKKAFLRKLSINQSQRKKLYEHLVHFLYVAESNDKAEIMGLVYRERILDHINDDMFLRLCTAVNKAFVDDLKHLKSYLDISEKQNHITDNLCACGLLSTLLHDRLKNSTLTISTGYKLNDVGYNLCSILSKAGWL